MSFSCTEMFDAFYKKTVLSTYPIYTHLIRMNRSALNYKGTHLRGGGADSRGDGPRTHRSSRFGRPEGGGGLNTSRGVPLPGSDLGCKG